MIEMFGNMWSVWKEADLFLVTGNSTVTENGLVMGRGIARQARDKFPGLSKVLGNELKRLDKDSGAYGLLISRAWPISKLGLFQVKTHWADQANPELIAFSTRKLIAWCGAHPRSTVHLNYPGIGNGRLGIDVVSPIISQLPDNVFVWQLKEQGS